MTVELRDLVATTEETDSIIGNLFWFSVGGKEMINKDELKQLLIESGVGEEWLPNSIRPVDAFRRATRETQTRRPTSTAGVYENILVREVYSDNDIIQRNIVIETVDQNDKKLGYETQSGVIKLNKEYGTFQYEAEESAIKELCEEAREKFYLYRDHYSSQHLRVLVNRVLHSLAPTPMRRNGMIYFIPTSMSNGLRSLVTFIQSLKDSEGYQVPVVNSTNNKKMVNTKLKHHFDEFANEIEKAKVSDLSKGQLKALVKETNEAIEDYKEYKTIITSEQEYFEKRIFNLRSDVNKIMREKINN